jgi:uncharacterized protein (TIGR00645 family)
VETVRVRGERSPNPARGRSARQSNGRRRRHAGAGAGTLECAARRNTRIAMLEKPLEKLLFSCRWLLAPLYLGLALALVALGVKFFQEAFHVIGHIWTISEADLVLTALALIDLVLVGSLIVMVMFSGYENFVSRIDTPGAADALGWLGKLDAGTLKLKVAASIVAISSIHLLRIFMNAQQIDNDKLLWYVVLHLTFVVSALLLGVLDRISFAGHRDKE